MTFLVGLPPTAQGELCRVCAPDDAARPPRGSTKHRALLVGELGGGGFISNLPPQPRCQAPAGDARRHRDPPSTPNPTSCGAPWVCLLGGAPGRAPPSGTNLGLLGGAAAATCTPPPPLGAPRGACGGAPPVVPSVGARPATCRPPRPGAARGD